MMTPQQREAADLRKLSEFGFSSGYITELLGNGWTLERIIKKTESLLDQGLTTLSHAAETFQETYPDALDADFVQPDSGLLSLFRPLTEFEQKQAEWLVPGYIPKGQITTLASDGGIGKTSFWVNLAASVSSGKPSFLDGETASRKPQKVLFLSTEDSVSIVLKRRLALAEAVEENLIAPDFSLDHSGKLRELKFGTPQMEEVISQIRPALCIFDPIQGFVPHGIAMGDRAAMRDCMAPLITLGEKYGTTFLVVCHTNKRQKASGRDRIADSADLWDISRSVLMMGWTEEDGVRYLSQEKSNYGTLQESILFTIDDLGIVHAEGRTWKRDREYQADAEGKRGKKEDCQAFILRTLEEAGGKMRIKELEEAAEPYDFAEATWKRGKAALSKANKIRTYPDSINGKNTWFIELTYFPPSPTEITN